MHLGLNRKLLMAAVVSTMFAIGGVLYWYWYSTSDQPVNSADMAAKEAMLEKTSQLLSAGDYQAVLEEANELLQDSDPAISIRAQRFANEANFMIGSRESRLAAVRGTEDLFIRLDGYPEDQGLVVANLLNYLSMAPEGYIFDEIFNEGPFSAFLVKGSYIDSIKNLAEYSLSLKPTTTALARVGWWHADKILEVSRSYDLDATAKKAAADEILSILASRQTLFAQETDAAGDDSLAGANFYFWQASLYQAVARVYPEYISEALESLQALHGEYDASKELGNGLSTIAVLIPYAELYYAQALYEVEGETSLSQVKERLAILIETVEADPDIHRAGFIAMIERQAAYAPRYQMFRQPTYARFIEEVPEFKVFLESYGWSPATE